MFGRNGRRNLHSRRAAPEKLKSREPTEADLAAAVVPAAAAPDFLLLKPSPKDERDLQFPVSAHFSGLPSSVDLSASMPRALDQGAIGSCAANAGGLALRYLYKKQLQQDWLPSRLALYFVTRVYMTGDAPDEDTGCYLRDLCKAIAKYQLPPEMYWKYDPAKFSQPPPYLQKEEMAPAPLVEYRAVPRTEFALKQALAGSNPVVIGIMLYESFVSNRVALTGAAPMPDAAREARLGGHAVLLVGYTTSFSGVTTWNLINSWGTSWGKAGKFTLPCDYLTNPNLCFDAWCFTKVIES